jgi:PAS domain S-box-containing protein
VTPIHIPRISRGLLVLAILGGPVLGFSAFRLAGNVERDRAQVQLEHRVATAAFTIDRELAADLEVLYALRSLFELGPPVTRESFARATLPFLARHPYLRALEWIPRVSLADRQSHEQPVRDEGETTPSITEPRPAGEPASADERDWYAPVTFVEPREGSTGALGIDLASDRLHREAMDRTAATGEPALTDPISLVKGSPEATAVLAVLAVFEDDPEVTIVNGRTVRGFVLAVFDIEGLLQHARLGPGSGDFTGIRFELVDEDVDGRSVVIHGLPLDPKEKLVHGMLAEQSIEVGDQRWRFVARPTTTYLKPLRSRQPLLLGTVAAVAWELLVGFVVILGNRSRDRLERRHARLMEIILESLSDGVIVADTGGTILTANRAATAITGRGAPDAPPSAWSEIFGFFQPGTERLFPADQLPLSRAIRGEATNNIEIFVRNSQVPDGTYVSVSGSPMLDGRGRVRGGVVVFRDISARKQTEERLQRLSSAVEQTADSVLITDRQGTIEYVNPAFEATTGYSSAEAVGRSPNILKSGVQRPEYYRELWTTIIGGETFRGTTVNRKKNGELYHAEQTITPMKDRDGHITHFVSVLKDMTERHRIQQQEIELELASMVQRRLFPAAPPRVPGYDIAGAVFPAAATSGDYFDYIPFQSGALGLVAADVSGHGLGPALVMAETRAYLRSLTQTTDDLGSITSSVNRFLVADLQDNFFVTMLLAKLEPGSGRLTCVNSAHPSGFIIDTLGNVGAELSSRCIPLGLFLDRWRHSVQEALIGPGELLVLVTDGVLESRGPDGEEFGTERLTNVVSSHRQSSAHEIVGQVFSAVQDFSQDQTQVDDVTIVICKRNQEAS